MARELPSVIFFAVQYCCQLPLFVQYELIAGGSNEKKSDFLLKINDRWSRALLAIQIIASISSINECYCNGTIFVIRRVDMDILCLLFVVVIIFVSSLMNARAFETASFWLMKGIIP